MNSETIPPIRIRGQQQKDFAIRTISKINPEADVELRFGTYKKDRSKAQNRLYYMWISQVSKQRQDETPDGVRAEFKLDLGIPILLEADAEFFEWWHSNGFNRLTREANLANMKYTPVTSLMKVGQFSLLLREIEMLATRQGWHLTFPSDIYEEAMGR